MTTAAADVNPLSTGCGRNLAMNSSLNSPMPACMMPTRNASVDASRWYRTGSSSGSWIGERPAVVRSATMATGPTASCREDPTRA